MGGYDGPSKLRKGFLIGRNWGCSVQDSIPATLRPRECESRHQKAKIGSNAPDAPWQQWSLDLLTQLAQLSSMTIGKLVFAQELMVLEVRQRQQDLMSHQRNLAEILKSDLERINKDLGDGSRDAAESEEESDEDDEAEEGNGDHENEVMGLEDDSHAPGPAGLNGRERQERAHSGNPNIKTESLSEDVEMAVSTQDRTSAQRARPPTQPPTPGPTLKSKVSLKNRVRILRLRADAMRLKQEAAKRMAEAYELEVKMLVAEAKEAE